MSLEKAGTENLFSIEMFQTNGARVIIIVILKEKHEADGPTCFTVLRRNEKNCNSV